MPNREHLRCGFVGAGVELLGGEGAQRVRHDDRPQRVHAERGALDGGLMFEDGGDDDGCGNAGLLQADGVVRTARRAAPSITDPDQRDVVLRRDPRDQLVLRVDREALLLVARHRRERRVLGEQLRRALEDAPAVPLRVVENPKAQAGERSNPRREVAVLGVHLAARIVDAVFHDPFFAEKRTRSGTDEPTF